MMDNTIERRTNNLTHVETMFDARRTPWDGLGKKIAGAVTSRDAIRLAGLDWNVVPTDIISEATGLKIPGYKANVRDIDNKTLGIVTERYKIVQNEEAFAFTDELLGEGVTYETAGALAPVLEDGSDLFINCDDGVDVLVIKDGKCIQEK